MSDPRVSVIIPAYNQAEYLGEAIRSIQNQTFQDFEVIIVDDASTDHTFEVVHQFDNPKIKYIAHATNKMLPAARNSGIRASTGEIVAFLDADDTFHPLKLERHVAYLQKNPDIGVTYNSRFEMDSSGNILGLSKAPRTTDLSDFVLGFPFAPSDMVVRRAWLQRVNLFDESYTEYSEDLDIYCRLSLAGCKFSNVGGYLNYRRRHPGRMIGNVEGRLQSAIRALELAFKDPNCPPEVVMLRDQAYAIHYLAWGLQEIVQGDVVTGQVHILNALRLNPSIAAAAFGLPTYLVWFSIRDGGDHVEILEKIFRGLPGELSALCSRREWAIGQGYLMRGERAVLWGFEALGMQDFASAARVKARIDLQTLLTFSDQLTGYEQEFGVSAADQALQRLLRGLRTFATPSQLRWFESLYTLNRAFAEFGCGNHSAVPGYVLRAMLLHPLHLANRGVLSILVRSLNSLISGQNRYEKVGNTIGERKVERL